MIALLVLLVTAVLGACVYERLRYHADLTHQMPVLAKAIHFYHHSYDALPPSVRAIEARGSMGRGACRLPRNGWESWQEHSGPEVLYVPVVDWDGETAYVIAVQPPIGRSVRLYLVAGDTSVHQATEADLAKILARDDELRAATGQPGRWDQVPWRSPVAGAP